MRLPNNTLIDPEKLTGYLLVFKKHNDKSRWLAKAGYTLETWQVLQDDLRKQFKFTDAEFIEITEYGKMYQIKGKLKDPNKIGLCVSTIWIIESNTGISKFVTMYPDKKK